MAQEPQPVFYGDGDESDVIPTEKDRLSPMRQMLSKLKDKGRGNKEWADPWDEETLVDLRIALQQKTPDEEIPPSLDAAILDKAEIAFKQFAPYIPLLYLAEQSEFEARLSEIFCEAVQTTEEAQMSYVQVLLNMLDYRTTQYYLNRFISRSSPELEQVSTFRKAVIDWYIRSEDKVHHKKAFLPIDAAITARRIEISKVKEVAAVKEPRGKQHPSTEKPRYPDDALVKVVKEVCATSKPFAYKFLGIDFNSSGAFDDVRQELIDINNRRKKGELKAHKNLSFSTSELKVLVKVLMIAHEKLHAALESSQVNLNKSHCDKLNEEMKKNRGYEKTIRELTKRLDLALADNAKISGLQDEIKLLKKDIMQIATQNQALRERLAKEQTRREQAEARVKELHLENSNLSRQLQEEQGRSQHAEAEKERLRAELVAERAEKQRVEDELRALRELTAAPKPSCQNLKKDSYQVGASQAFFGPAQSEPEEADLHAMLASLQSNFEEGAPEQATTVVKPGYGSPEDQSE